MDHVSFAINFPHKKQLIFSNQTHGLIIEGREYLALDDGVLIYDRVKNLQAESITVQLSSNTSTLIPGLKVLGLVYPAYFDKHEVVESQNNIRFYWKPSKLAEFYNRFGTDVVPYPERKGIIRDAVDFLISNSRADGDFLPEEMLEKIQEPCKLLGFYGGFPIFDANSGMPKLLSKLGIHVGQETVMVSTPFDNLSAEVVEVSKLLEKYSGQKGRFMRNRVVFEKTPKLLSLFNFEHF